MTGLVSLALPQLSIAKLAIAGVAAIGLVAGGAYAGYRWELSAYQSLRAADAAAYAAGVKAAAADQHARDGVSVASASHDAAAQTKIVDHYITITKEITSHVPDTVACIPYGLVRVLNSAAGPAAYPVPDAAGEPDDACAPVTWRSVAADLTADYQASAQNSQQLTDLQQWARDQQAVNGALK